MTEEFRKRINEFVIKQLKDYTPTATNDKTIHDTIWGSVLYNSWEIAIIDSPLFQRLRDIQQLGKADITYPAARHTRFEHSLGVTAIASRMIDKLSERSSDIITPDDKNQIRLAALLHDIGHCFYSHLSENVYGNMPQFLEIRKELELHWDKGLKPKPHEILSYLIITSEAFICFFFKQINYPNKKDFENCKKLLFECANMIVGQTNIEVNKDGKIIEKAYLTHILNGDFDADKMDYTQRDSYTTGIALTYGIERFLMKIVLCKFEKNGRTVYDLAIREDAVTTVEELIFNRNMLYVYMYRHQKVLAVEAAIRDVIHAMVDCGMITHPCDFLEYSDRNIETLDSKDLFPYPELAPNRTISGLAKDITRRSLPKRVAEIKASALEITDAENLKNEYVDRIADEVEKEKSIVKKRELMKEFAKSYTEEFSEDKMRFSALKIFADKLSFSDYKKYTEIRVKLYERLCKVYRKNRREPDFDIFDLHIVFPPLSSGNAQFLVLPKQESEPELNSFEYISQWSKAFNASNYKGYVFVNPKIDRNLIAPAVKDFLSEYNQNVRIKEI